VLVATPGRLNDALDRRLLVLPQCDYVVLDEADKMVDMGFEPQVHAILAAMPVERGLDASRDEADTTADRPRRRQTHMFSATMRPSIERIARHYLREPVYVHVGGASGANENITQRVVVLHEREKQQRLVDLFAVGPPPPVIVFANSRHRCDELARALDGRGFSVATLHAGKDQTTREAAITRFASGAVGVLVATDVAGRGLDLDRVEHVVNYDMPTDLDAYTHRIGRTGRAGRKGVATTFVTGEGAERDGVLCELVAKLTSCGQAVPPELARLAAAHKKQGKAILKSSTAR